MIQFSVSRPDFAKAVTWLEKDTVRTVVQVLHMVGIETVAYLRSLTDEMRPPVGARARTRADGSQSSTLGRRQRKGRLRKDGTRGRRTGPRETGRPAHPGHWADVRGTLALGYQWSVDPVGSGAILTLSNPVEYAAALEARDGYFVLGGVMDPGGPVEQAIERAAALVAPTWQFRRSA